ncbi:alpha/beta fold hydrolase [Saccharothrix coeruleofusca]|uniref:Hydrolase n=1 Tax=Saccharothrix coeruleofusca TaxID=33919 RepID=A0A918EGM6_9PSEU|nr:alpha/beta fold hydrolase [Saccharothrix coeruleofusca]MBP2334768.1 pimeloyl-ACP methyl ester carboxylesterase [Saccharothrix coeruleofusca]GGP74321.1 hydrolase [Saccharothrix coeruleofusca]
MPFAPVNGIHLHYSDTGGGDPVLLLMGSGSPGRVWHAHQVPALLSAGYRVITVDNRGIEPSSCPDSFTVHDMVGDVVGLIDHLGLSGVRVVGTSLGAYVAQELALARPDLVRQVVLMASRARSDAFRTALARAEIELYDSGVRVPAAYRAVITALTSLSRSTLDDHGEIRDWLDLFELVLPDGPGVRAQLALEPMPDRTPAYGGIRVPCHVIAFSDDVLTPPAHGEELAGIIPGATFEVVAGAGHYGYLERPEAVNDSIVKFFHA